MRPVFGFQWHLTDACNLRCRHCYQERRDAGAALGLGGWLDLADRLTAALPGYDLDINLTGGEPLLLPELPALVAGLDARPAVRRLAIITNGTVADPTVLGRLAGASKLTTFKISLEAGRASANDAVRGPGSFARVEANLPRFAATGRELVLMCTLGRHNLDEISATVGFARGAGFAGVIFERFVPLGAGARIDGLLSPAEWRQALQAIARAADLDAEPEELLAWHAFWLDFAAPPDERLRGAACNLGPDSMALMPDGTVFPCRRLPLDIGNLARDDFARLRQRLAQWGAGAVRARLRGRRCGLCGVEGCVGCRALARAVMGDALGDDPECPLHETGMTT